MGYLVSCESQRLWGLLQRTELTGFSVASSKAPWLPLPFIGLSGKQPRAEMSPQGVGLCFFWPVLPLLAKSTLRKTRGWIGRNSGLEFWFHHSVKKKEKRLCNLWQVTRPQFPHLENGNHFFFCRANLEIMKLRASQKWKQAAAGSTPWECSCSQRSKAARSRTQASAFPPSPPGCVWLWP